VNQKRVSAYILTGRAVIQLVPVQKDLYRCGLRQVPLNQSLGKRVFDILL
jgi:hypothetical protein